MSAIRLEELGIPEPGHPDRGREIVRLVLQLIGLFVFFAFLLAVVLGGILFVAAATDTLPVR